MLSVNVTFEKQGSLLKKFRVTHNTPQAMNIYKCRLSRSFTIMHMHASQIQHSSTMQYAALKCICMPYKYNILARCNVPFLCEICTLHFTFCHKSNIIQWLNLHTDQHVVQYDSTCIERNTYVYCACYTSDF